MTSKLPAVNIIEKVSGILETKVYANKRQFSSLSEQTEYVFKEWSNLNPKYFLKVR